MLKGLDHMDPRRSDSLRTLLSGNPRSEGVFRGLLESGLGDRQRRHDPCDERPRPARASIADQDTAPRDCSMHGARDSSGHRERSRGINPGEQPSVMRHQVPYRRGSHTTSQAVSGWTTPPTRTPPRQDCSRPSRWHPAGAGTSTSGPRTRPGGIDAASSQRESSSPHPRGPR